MANYHDGYLEQGQPIGLAAYDVLLTADNQAVDVSACRLLRLSSDNTTSTNRTFTLSGPANGYANLVIVFMSGSSTAAELASSGNVKLNSTWSPTQYESLSLQWDGTYWVETGRKTPGGVVASSITNAMISASAAIDFSKLAALTSANILVGNGSNVATSVAVSGDVTISNAGVVAIGANKVLESMMVAPSTAGLNVKRVAKAIYNSAAGFGIGAHTLSVTIPNKAFVTGMWYFVATTFTSATDAATIALSIEGADDCVSAIAISDVSNPWDATSLPVEGIPVIETTSTWLATSQARAITATVAIEALTAGVMHVWVEYIAYP